jgi:hypothetical protein
MTESRRTAEELAQFHDVLCGEVIGEGPCTCLVARVIALEAEAGRLRLGRRGFQVMARNMALHADAGFWLSAIEDGKYERAGGDVECELCRQMYIEHPQLEGYPTFHLTCKGEIVKL